MIHLINGTLLNGGKYRIKRFISSGGFGCTYEGEHTMLGARVAIKEFFVKDFCNRNDQTGAVEIATYSKEALVGKLKKKFVEEARVLCQFSHPNIVHVNDIFEENGTAYYVMDYIDGESLSEKVQRQGHLGVTEAVGYILKVADALEYVHNHSRLHLDVKPGNIMVDQNNRVVLIDFGVSKHYDDESGENTSTMLGVNTPGFAPIEQSTQSLNTFSPATDIYALGATLYKLLTGITPPNSVAIMNEDASLAPLPQTISPFVRNAVMQAMQVKRKDRPQSIAAFRKLLKSGEACKRDEGINFKDFELKGYNNFKNNNNARMDHKVKEEPAVNRPYNITPPKPPVKEPSKSNWPKIALFSFILLVAGVTVGYLTTRSSDDKDLYPIADDVDTSTELAENIVEDEYSPVDSVAIYESEVPVYKSGDEVYTASTTTETIDYEAWGYTGTYKGELLGGVPYGYGTFTSEAGDKYVGNWKDGLAEGNGTFAWANGDKYVGRFNNGKRNGRGTFTWGENSEWAGDKYVGNFIDDYRNGQGTYYYSNGNVYEGEWKNGESNGQGTFTWPDGDKYVGDFVDGYRTGQGTYTWPDGDKYVGQWKNSKMNGQGTYYYSNGNVYEGDWKDDKRTGQGTFTWPGGDKYIGDFVDGVRVGHGTYTWPDGDKYIGQWKDSKMNGQGTYYFSSGDKYVGEWKDDKKHGQGIFYNADGTIWRKGQWENDNFVE